MKSTVQVESSVENSPRVLGVLSGGDISDELLKKWAKSADRILAADAGADLLLGVQLIPHLVIGDMDSVSQSALSAAREISRIGHQDNTDCDKLLLHAAEEGHPSVTLIGVEGDLPDHVLAILHSAARSALDVRLAYRRGIGWIVKPGRSRRISTQTGRRTSLLAIEPCEGVHLEGCQWPLRNAELSPTGPTSISNRTEADEVAVTIAKGAALLFVEFPFEEMPVW